MTTPTDLEFFRVLALWFLADVAVIGLLSFAWEVLG